MKNLDFIHVDPLMPAANGPSRMRRPVYGELFVLDGGPCLLVADDNYRLTAVPVESCRPCLDIGPCRFCVEFCPHRQWAPHYVAGRPSGIERCRGCGLERIVEAPE